MESAHGALLPSLAASNPAGMPQAAPSESFIIWGKARLQNQGMTMGVLLMLCTECL
jgi:hypothetical protein